MSSSSTPPNPEQAETREPREQREPSRRLAGPFWLFLAMLLGVLGLLLFTLLRPAPVPPPAAVPPLVLRETPPLMLERQHAYNAQLEEELRRLQALLRQEPCVIAESLGQSPERMTPAPGYMPPPAGNQTGTPGAAPEKAPAPSAGGAQSQAAPAPLPQREQPLTTVADLMDRATVFVLSTDGENFGMGSGFFVAPGIIVTNRHVVEGRTGLVMVGNKFLGGMHKAAVIALSRDPMRDYALLRLPAKAGAAPVLQIAPGAGRTERVSAWGFPGYITDMDPKLRALIEDGDIKAVPEVVYSEGVVSVVQEGPPPMILHTASLSQGNSGGPLILPNGIVAGVNTLIRKADKSYAQSNIALPGEDLIRFLREQGVAPTLAPPPQPPAVQASAPQPPAPEAAKTSAPQAGTNPPPPGTRNGTVPQTPPSPAVPAKPAAPSANASRPGA